MIYGKCSFFLSFAWALDDDFFCRAVKVEYPLQMFTFDSDNGFPLVNDSTSAREIKLIQTDLMVFCYLRKEVGTWLVYSPENRLEN